MAAAQDLCRCTPATDELEGGGDAAANSTGGNGENFVAFILALWTTAALYEKHLERPCVAFLHKNTTLRPGMVPLRLQLDEALNELT
jgi:hypothetical protein